ncbi:MAG: hypothetical protein HOV84_10525 [Streptomyces sp.]|nr:hypothetical protein [Streptomyces sp.]
MQTIPVLRLADTASSGAMGMSAGTAASVDATSVDATSVALVHLASVAYGRLTDRALGP